MRRCVNFCWSLFKWGFALALVAALSAGGYLYFRLDEEIRRYAEGVLDRHYQNLDVRIASARFVPGRGVTFFDISFGEPASETLRASASPTAGKTILRIGELSLHGAFEIAQLLEGRPTVDRVVIRRPELLLVHSNSGAWSYEQLLPLPPRQMAGGPPPIDVIDATLFVADAANPGTSLVFRSVNVGVTHGKAATDGAASSPLAGGMRITGDIKDSLAERIEFTVDITPQTGRLAATARIDRLRVTSDLLAAVPGLRSPALAELKLQALASGQATLNRAAAAAPLDWRATVAVENGSVSHPALPAPITNLTLDGSCNPQGATVRSCQARLGAAQVSLACNRSGWSARAPVALRGRITDLPLDEKLGKALPPSLQKHWRRFRPAGLLDLTGTLTYDGQRWKPDATFDCRKLSVEDHHKFPYRLTGGRCSGRFFDIGNDAGNASSAQFEFQLQGLAEGRPVTVAANFSGLPCPGGPAPPPRRGPKPPCPVGWVEINAARLRVSEAMLAALKPHEQAYRIARAVSPSGEFGVRWRMDRASAAVTKPDITIDIVAHDCRIEYDKFPYPVDHIRGRLTAINGEWKFEGLESRMPDGPELIVARGALTREHGLPKFTMTLSAVAAPLNETLRRALPPEQQALWRRLRPQGRVSLTTDVSFTVGDAKPTIDLAVQPYERTVSLEPDFFQYRLDRLDGRFVMLDGKLEFVGARAEHGRTVITSDGSWAPLDAGGWRFNLQKLHVDYLDADHDLRLAAPLPLRKVIDEIRPEGSFGLDKGRLAFTYDPKRPGALRADWDIELDCHQADVNFGVPVKGVSGAVRLTGVSTGNYCYSSGQLELDTMFWNGLQLTNVRGPLWAGREECLLGEGVAEKPPSSKPARITADAYGGKVSLNTRVLHGQQPQYSMAIQLKDVDLDRFSRDFLHTTTPLAGKVDGRLTLNGQGSTVFGLSGTGAIEVREANLYELPLTVALLKVLRNRVPDTVAFDGAQAEFTMQGKHLQFTRLVLLGDAVSLHGRGEASLDKALNLTFHTIVGRGGVAIPFLNALVGQASEQIMRLRVLGTVDEPDIRREALPMVGNVLEQLRADLQPRPLSQPAEVPRAAALRRQAR